jgi:type IV pilus assembly protein PilQ
MNIKQNNKLLQVPRNFFSGRRVVSLFLLLFQMGVAWADDLSIKGLNFATLAGDKVQLQLEMDGPAVEPKVFQTDNPARIALDFSGVKSALTKKSFLVNKGAASSVYVVEVAGRTRVVINLAQSVPYDTSVAGNTVLLTLNQTTPPPVENKQKSVKVEAVPESALEAVTEKVSPTKARKQSVVARFLPKQAIKDVDFRRGATGNGLLLIALAKPNTVVDVKESGGKVVLKFLNTTLPDAFRKRFDVSDFATPVQKIDAVSVGADTVLTVSTADGNYEYSSYQANGLLTVDFKPLTREEKEAAAKKKFPYSGNKLSLNFQDIPVRDVLQVLADFTEFNMITTDAVGGNITLRLNDVPWDQALDLILKSKGLGQRKAGNVVWIAPTEEITKLDKDEEESQKVSVRIEPLKTEYIQINYAKAEDIKAMLMGQGTSSAGGAVGANRNNPDEIETGKLLSSRGIASVDPRTNLLIVKDIVARLDEIRGLIKLLDIPIRQVMIEARIVNANKDFAKALGVKFGVAKGAQIGAGKFFSLSGDQSVKTSNILNGTTPYVEVADNNALVDLGAAMVGGTPPAALAMTLARAADYVLNLELSAMQNEKKGQILANPRVMTSDRKPATITSGQKIQLTTPGSGINPPTQVLVDANLKLTVTPQITPDGSIITELNISNDTPTTSGGIDVKNITTTVQINDGETIVLGGVYQTTENSIANKIPFFGDLPGVGFLFRNSNDTKASTELLFFITPKIVKQSLSVR